MGECLDLEVLSAYIDGTLDVRERAKVEAHLASCADCYDVMSEVLRIQEAIPAARPASSSTSSAWGTADAAPERRDAAAPVPRPGSDTVVRGAFGRRKAVWRVAGVVLAAAAAVVLVVRLQPTWWTGGVDPKLAGLVEAVGEERTVEARLTGGFKYGPLRSPMRSGGRVGPTDNWSLLAAAGKIREEAEKDPTPENAHAAGIGSLLLGDIDTGIQLLENAARVDSQPRLLNDLAAAYDVRHRLRGTADDLPRALESVEKALALAPNLPEALFNRALLLEAMGLRRAASEAWEAFLRIDGDSGWANEARRHLEALKPSIQSDGARSLQPADSSPSDPGSQIAEGADSRSQRAIERLAAWATLWLAGAYRTPGGMGSVASIAAALTPVVGAGAPDAMWADELSTLRALQEAGKTSAIDAAARGYLCLSRLKGLRSTANVAAVKRVAGECRMHLARGDMPLAAWATLYLSSGAVYDGNLGESESLARLLTTNPRYLSYRALLGRAQYLIGGIAYIEGRFLDALESLRVSTQLLDGVQEPEFAASAHDVLGAAYLAVGDRQAAWRSFVAALRTAPESAGSLGGYATRNSVGVASLRLGYPRVAKTLFQQNLEDALAIGASSRLAESHYNLAQMHDRLKDTDKTSTHILESRRALSLVSDPGLNRRLEAELLMIESELALPTNSALALEKAVAARAAFEASGTHIESARLLRQEALALFNLNEDRASAWRALDQAMSLLESQEGNLQQRRMQVTFRDTVWSLYADAIRLRVVERDFDGAMHLFDRARSRRLMSNRAQLASSTPRAVDPDTAILAFHCGEDAIYRWVITSDDVQFRAIAMPRVELDALVWQARLDIEGDQSDEPAAWASLSALLLGDLPQAAQTALRWVLVPDGPLYRVPFAVLKVSSDADPIFEDHELAVASTIHGHDSRVRTPTVADRDRSSRVFIMTGPENAAANLPSLPASREEAERITAFYPQSVTAAGADATAEALMSALAAPGAIVHFAGHALADASMPWTQHLVVSPSASDADGLIYASDLESVEASADVVVLAACSTAEGFEFRGEGLASVANAFIRTGVPWVVGTLWDIPDAAASEFFVRLHRALAAGLQPPTAVRRAQRESRAAHVPRSAWASVVVLVQ